MGIPYEPYVVQPNSVLRNDFVLAGVAGFLLTGLSLALALTFGWMSVENLNWFEVLATFFNYASFYLCVKQRRAYYIIGILGYLAFIVVYVQANLLASTALSAYLSVALIVGFFMWRKDSDPLPVSQIEGKWIPAYILTTLAAFGGAWLIVSALGGSFAPWDSVILVFTILAQFMLDRKKIENWAVWIIFVNGAGTVVYFASGLYLVAFQQIIFGIFSVWGWYEWNKSYKASNPLIKEAKIRGDYEHLLSIFTPWSTGRPPKTTRIQKRQARKFLEQRVAAGEGLER